MEKLQKRVFTPKRIINALLFIVICVLTFSVIFKNNDINDIISNIGNTNKIYIFMGIGCMFIYIFLEGFNIYRILKTFKCDITITKTFKYSLVGFFFSSITPSSTGGQPMQLYFMNKDKISLSHGALALLIQLLSYQFISLILAIMGFILNYDILMNYIGNIKYLIIFGVSINLIIQLFLIIMIFSKTTGRKLIEWTIKILKRIHLKNTKSIKDKALIQLDEYHNCAEYLKNNKLLLIKIFVTTFFQLSLYQGVPYFVYRAFGFSDASLFTFIGLQSVLYIAVAAIPLPGSMGVSEGSFMILFKMFFPATILSSAMLISRGISFYLFLIISITLIIIFMIIDNINQKNSQKKSLNSLLY